MAEGSQNQTAQHEQHNMYAMWYFSDRPPQAILENREHGVE